MRIVKERPPKALTLNKLIPLVKKGKLEPLEIWAVRNNEAASRIYRIVLDLDTKIYNQTLITTNTDAGATGGWTFGFQHYNVIDYTDTFRKNPHCYIFEDYWFAQAYLQYCKSND